MTKRNDSERTFALAQRRARQRARSSFWMPLPKTAVNRGSEEARRQRQIAAGKLKIGFYPVYQP